MKTKIGLFLFALMVLNSCEQTESKVGSQIKKGMVKVTILYPNEDGKTFNMDYYSNKHMPMVARLLGDSLKFFSVDEGKSGRTAEDPLPYLAIGYLYFDTLSDYQDAFAPVAGEIVKDIPNYTNIKPVIQINEVHVSPTKN